jgi:hypothetical protein
VLVESNGYKFQYIRIPRPESHQASLTLFAPIDLESSPVARIIQSQHPLGNLVDAIALIQYPRLAQKLGHADAQLVPDFPKRTIAPDTHGLRHPNGAARRKVKHTTKSALISYKMIL